MNFQRKNKMENVLIAYNNASDIALHIFFESCADEVRQASFSNGHSWTDVCPPDLNEENVVGQMENFTICMLASHGDAYGIYNEVNEDVVTTRTTNYSLSGKIFYAIACGCAEHLLPHLKAIGLSHFVGYDDVLIVVENNITFVETTVSGLVSLLSGESVEVAKKKMYDLYTESINKATSKEIKRFLLHNREHLCFE